MCIHDAKFAPCLFGNDVGHVPSHHIWYRNGSPLFFSLVVADMTRLAPLHGTHSNVLQVEYVKFPGLYFGQIVFG